LFSILYILLICDLKNFYLPLYLNLSITLVAIISGFFGIALIKDYSFLNISNISLSLIGFIFGYFFLWSINLMYKLIKKEDGIGGGDFILLGGIGTIVGPLSIASIILLGSLSTLIIMISNPKKYAKELPLGAGLIFGLFVYIIFEYFELFPFMYVI
jgi:leader peptidase (prepilin peptidase)/N-methyltransferase